MDDSIKQKILYEIAQIDEAIDSTTPLRALCKLKTPDIVEKSAVALLLQSFYNGIENILTIIIKYYDSKLPNSSKWHKELLGQSFEATQSRKQIFRPEMRTPLTDYMSMRHFIRHTYGFRLNWDQMSDLTNGIEDTWEMLKEDLQKFISQ